MLVGNAELSGGAQRAGMGASTSGDVHRGRAGGAWRPGGGALSGWRAAERSLCGFGN